ncbi:DNA excision repair protein ERCC-6-like [Ciona intestinalis]
MYDLFQNKRKGGILADDMGLGKTIQVIALISALFDAKLIKHVLLVLPLSLIPNWTNEFANWAPGIKVEEYHGPVAKRKAILQQCMHRRSVCITTYGLIVTKWQTLGETLDGREFVWDYIILDEGHRIKNASKTTKGLHKIPSRNRIILTGTPVQNKVRDMWALMDWVTQGSLLGTQKTFKSSYEIPIECARQKGATSGQIRLGNMMSESLRKLTDPFILRRTKDGLTRNEKENCGNLACVDGAQDPTVLNKQPRFPKLSTKNDFVVWVYLSDIQQQIYTDFIQLDSVKELLSTHRSPLVYLTVLKKICDHPRLLSTKACVELGLESNDSMTENLDQEAIEGCAANRINNISDQVLMEESGKLQFLIPLLLRLREEGHRTLIFSMSRKMLNIIQRILMNLKFKVMRMDGLVTKLSEREKRVKLFQEDSSYDVFLLTTQVGGVGLTLTAADRVVIYDPSWNPATDSQAVDRIYRIGQKKSVAVYRLITCGSVEEKIYRRQIFKNSVIQQSTGQCDDPYRYFSKQELAELFQLDDVLSSSTQIQLSQLHSHQRKLDDHLQEHMNYLHELKMFGVSDHDLMFSQKPDDIDCDEEAVSGLTNQVELAQNRLLMESNQFTGTTDAEQRWGGFVSEERVADVKPKDLEPVYPIEGLTTKLETLQIPSPPKKEDIKPIKVEPNWEEEIVCLDSPLPSLLKKKVGTMNPLSYEDEEEEEDIILCGDSPMQMDPKQNVTSGNPSTPIVVEDSFDMFVQSNNNDSDTDELSSDDEWKKAFSETTGNVVELQPAENISKVSSALSSTMMDGNMARKSQLFGLDEDLVNDVETAEDNVTDLIDQSDASVSFKLSVSGDDSALEYNSPHLTNTALNDNNLSTDVSTSLHDVTPPEEIAQGEVSSNQNESMSSGTSLIDVNASFEDVAKLIHDATKSIEEIPTSGNNTTTSIVNNMLSDLDDDDDDITQELWKEENNLTRDHDITHESFSASDVTAEKNLESRDNSEIIFDLSDNDEQLSAGDKTESVCSANSLDSFELPTFDNLEDSNGFISDADD